MCFTGEMSAGFAALGLFLAWWVNKKTNNKDLVKGILFFFAMEFLQVIQYVFIASGLEDKICKDPIELSDAFFSGDVAGVFNFIRSHPQLVLNKILTLAGFLHICLQPYYTHLLGSSLTKSCKYKDRFFII